MKALLFRHAVLRYLATRSVYAWARPLWSVRLAPLNLVQLTPPLSDPVREVAESRQQTRRKAESDSETGDGVRPRQRVHPEPMEDRR